MVIGYSLVSWRWGRFEEVDREDVVLVDSGSVDRKWMPTHGSSEAVDPQGASLIGGDGRRPGVVRYLASRSRCRLFLFSGRTAHRSPRSHQGSMSNELQIDYR